METLHGAAGVAIVVAAVVVMVVLEEGALLLPSSAGEIRLSAWVLSVINNWSSVSLEEDKLRVVSIPATLSAGVSYRDMLVSLRADG